MVVYFYSAIVVDGAGNQSITDGFFEIQERISSVEELNEIKRKVKKSIIEFNKGDTMYLSEKGKIVEDTQVVFTAFNPL